VSEYAAIRSRYRPSGSVPGAQWGSRRSVERPRCQRGPIRRSGKPSRGWDLAPGAVGV